MRKNWVIGNWKMNLGIDASQTLVKSICQELFDQGDSVQVGIAPPFTALYPLKTLMSGMPNHTHLKLGAQNMSFEESGAYTGEVAPFMLKDLGCTFVIIGHSERRTLFKENNAMINRKLHLTIKHALLPVLCVGESLLERKNNNHFAAVEKQLIGGLQDVEGNMSNVVIAYEPVWAIGTGETASPEQAQEMHAYIRNVLSDMFGDEIAQNTSVLYGGSCNDSNAESLFSLPDVDGGLIGGASLVASKFVKIIDACGRLS